MTEFDIFTNKNANKTNCNIDGISLSNFLNFIGLSYGLGRFPNISEQSNYFAANGLNVTTNSLHFNFFVQQTEASSVRLAANDEILICVA